MNRVQNICFISYLSQRQHGYLKTQRKQQDQILTQGLFSFAASSILTSFKDFLLNRDWKHSLLAIFVFFNVGISVKSLSLKQLSGSFLLVESVDLILQYPPLLIQLACLFMVKSLQLLKLGLQLNLRRIGCSSKNGNKVAAANGNSSCHPCSITTQLIRVEPEAYPRIQGKRQMTIWTRCQSVCVIFPMKLRPIQRHKFSELHNFGLRY